MTLLRMAIWIIHTTPGSSIPAACSVHWHHSAWAGTCPISAATYGTSFNIRLDAHCTLFPGAGARAWLHLDPFDDLERSASCDLLSHSPAYTQSTHESFVGAWTLCTARPRTGLRHAGPCQ